MDVQHDVSVSAASNYILSAHNAGRRDDDFAVRSGLFDILPVTGDSYGRKRQSGNQKGRAIQSISQKLYLCFVLHLKLLSARGADQLIVLVPTCRRPKGMFSANREAAKVTE
jgi:hypothetical protein